MLIAILCISILILIKDYNIVGFVLGYITKRITIPCSEYSDLLIYKSRCNDMESQYWAIRRKYEESQKPPKYKVGDKLILNRGEYYNNYPAAHNQPVKVTKHNGLSAGFYHNIYTCSDSCGNTLKGYVYESELSEPCNRRKSKKKKFK